MFLLITQIVYNPFNKLINKSMGRSISLLKLTKYITRNPSKLWQLITAELDRSIIIIARHCVYEKRNRQHFDQKINVLYA